jgi:hypothetical protein
MIITGVERDSCVYEEFQQDRICLLDIITGIDDTKVSMTTLENLVTFDLFHAEFPPMSGVLTYGKYFNVIIIRS